MDNLFVIVGLTSILGVLVGFVMLLIRRFRSTGWKVLLAGCLAFGVSGYGLEGAPDRDAQSAGYVNAEDQELAAELGYTSAEDWATDRERILEERAQQREAEARAAAEEYQRRQAQAEQERLEAEAAERARLEAERLAAETAAQSAEDQRRAKMAAKTQRMTESIISALRQYYNFEAQPLLPNKPFCRKGGIPSCTIVAEMFDIRVKGAGIVEILTTTQSSHANYREMCSAVFSAISGSNLDFAAEAVAGAFLRAAQTGSFEHKVANTQITINQDSSGVLGCSFFKYGD